MTKEITSYPGFGHDFKELPEYKEYLPVNYKNWHSLKDTFKSLEYSYEKPLTLNIYKCNVMVTVNIYGFIIPEAPMVAAFGTPAAITGRVVLCRTVVKKEYIAIAW